MEYKVEFDIYNFPFWSGALDRIDEIRELGLEEEFGAYIEEMFADTEPTETDINDFVWFECDDWIEEHKEDRD